jgi:hypothetical protein
LSVPEQPLNLTAPLRASDPRKDELDPEVGGDLLEVHIGGVVAMIDMVCIRRNAAKTSLQFRLPVPVVPTGPTHIASGAPFLLSSMSTWPP